jgi:hypothetical protein
MWPMMGLMFDGRAAPKLTFDDVEDAARLPGDENAARSFCLVTAIALVDIGAFDGETGQP